MKKPEILKGEVLEYVDLVNHNYSITQTLGFYLQPFKPEMITEYFEGWELKGRTIAILDNLLSIDFYERGRFMEINGEYLARKVEWTMPYPLTNSQFITNCIQAGIKLTIN